MTTSKTQRKVSAATIRRWNEKFKALSKAEKRVAIAKDVIYQIQKGVFRPGDGYMSVLTSMPEDADIQKNITNIKCTGCALGSCMLSLVKFTNNVNKDELEDSYGDTKWTRLKKYFSPKQLYLIEMVYERSFSRELPTEGYLAGLFDYKVSLSDIKEIEILQDVYDKYPNTKYERLIVIMENIIRNQGTFKPLDI